MTVELIETRPVSEDPESIYRHASLGTWKRGWRFRTVQDGEELIVDLTVGAHIVPIDVNDETILPADLEAARKAQQEWDDAADALEMEDEEWEAWYAANPAPLWYLWAITTNWETFTDPDDRDGTFQGFDFDRFETQDAYTSLDITRGCAKAQLEALTLEDFDPTTRKFVSGDITEPRFPEPDTTTAP